MPLHSNEQSLLARSGWMPGATSAPMDMECEWEVAANGIPWSIDIQGETGDSVMGLGANEDFSDFDSSSLPWLLVCAM